MRRTTYLVVALALALLLTSLSALALADTFATASPAPVQGDSFQQRNPNDSSGDLTDESAIEQAKAWVAEQATSSPATITTFSSSINASHPLFVGVDASNVPAYRIEPSTNATIQAFVGAEVWGSAYDDVNDRVLFNSGTTLYEWPIGGTINQLGIITNPGGTAQSMVGLAYHNGTLYGTKNIANEAVYAIDTTTLVATVQIDYIDADYDFGGLAADPNSGVLYGTNDDATPHGSGLYRINPDGTATLVTPYPAGETDIDGLAISDDGFAYLVIDQPGLIYVYDLVAGAYVAPLTNPWTSSEVFAGGAWIRDPVASARIALDKTVVAVPGACPGSDTLSVPVGTAVNYCYEVTNTGTVTLTLHDLLDSQLGVIAAGLPYTLPPGASTTIITGSVTIITNTVNTATWTAYTSGSVPYLASASDTATVTLSIPTAVTLVEVAADASPVPVPASLPLAAVPGAVAMAGVAAYWLRQRR